MEKEILKQIVTQIDSFKDNQLLILIILFILFILITIIQTVYTSRLIEKYRNQLKKAELKFSVFNEIQISKLSEMYALASNLKGALAQILGSIERSENKINIGNWATSYSEFDSFYSSSKYIIPKSIKQLIADNKTTILSSYNCDITLLKKKFDLDYDRIESITNEEKAERLGLIERELLDFKPQKATLELMILAENIKVHIENYFEQIE
jgi:hypothetical protein